MPVDNFAILRTGKLKSLRHIESAAKHNYRMIPVRHLLNSNKDKVIKNDYLSVMPSTRALMPKKIRKNGVLAIEVILSLSPAYFRPNNPDACGEFESDAYENFEQSAVAFANSAFGDANIVSFVSHLSESSPHCHILFVPIDPRGRLNAAHFVGSPQILRDLQTKWASHVAPLGIKRGIDARKTRRSHVPIARFYAILRKLGLATLAAYARSNIGIAFDNIGSKLLEMRAKRTGRKFELKR